MRIRRTDLAMEARELWQEQAGKADALPGVEARDGLRDGIPVNTVRVLDRQGEQALGFRTTAGTRPVILAELVEIVREHTGWICDRTTLEEMLSFVRTPQGRPEAQPGAHDDCVMALAIAYHARRQMDPPEVFWGCAVSRGRGY